MTQQLPEWLHEYTDAVDPRFHSNISKPIADPKYRHRLYTMDENHLTQSDGSDPRILCTVCIEPDGGDARVHGIFLRNMDSCNIVLSISALRIAMSCNYPTYKHGDILIWYTIDGAEKGDRMTDYLKTLKI